MGKRYEATLQVNDVRVEINEFVEDFMAGTVVGAASSLQGSGDIQYMEFYMERGKVNASVNGKEIFLTPFPNDIIASTLTGMIFALRGIGEIDSLKINAKLIDRRCDHHTTISP